MPTPPIKTKARSHWIARYGLALAAVATAFLLREGLNRLAGGSLPVYITFYPTVMAVALLGGVGPGLLATLGAALIADYFILAPHGSLAIASLSDAVGLALFSGMGVFMTVVAELYRRARRKAVIHRAEVFSPQDEEEPTVSSRQGLLLNTGLFAALAILAAVGWQSMVNLRAVGRADQWEAHTHVVILELDRLLSRLKDAETGQRGYLLTGKEAYLEPYETALALLRKNLAELKQLTRDNARQQQRLAVLGNLLDQIVIELKQTIDLRRARGLPAALAVVTTDKGKGLMDEIRKRVAEAQAEEEQLLRQRSAVKEAGAGRTLQALMAGGVLSFLLLVTVFLFFKQEYALRVRAEAEVRHHRDHLQELVASRTEQLRRSNGRLTQEIEEHRQAKASLLQQREWLRVTLTSIGDAVMATDTGGRITFLNPIAQSLTCWPEKEALGQPVQSVFRIINEETREPGEDIVACVLREGKTLALANHTSLVARDGREVPIEDSAAPIMDGAGTVSGVVLVFHDVTQRRRTQQALRESRERLDLALSSSKMATFEWDIVNDKRHWSQAVHSLMGTTPEAFTGMAQEFFRVIHPEDRSGVQAALEQAVRTTDSYETEYRAVWPDGSIHHIAARGKVHRDRTCRAVLMTAVCWDITEKKKTEEALRRNEDLLRIITDNSPDPIFLKDRDSRIVLANPATLAAIGKPADAVVGKTDLEFYDDPEIGRAILEADRRIMESGQIQVIEEIVPAPTGPRIYLSTKTPCRDAQGRVSGLIGIARDITEHKKAEEARRKRAEEALHLSEEEFRALAEAMPQIVWATRPDGWNVYFNQQWVDYTGMTLEESYGHGWNTPFHPDDKQRAWEAWQHATQHQERYSLECRLRRADGAYRWWLIRGAPMRGANDEILKWFGTCTDIEEVKQAQAALQAANDLLEQRVAERTEALQISEQRFRLALQNAPVSVALQDRDLVYRWAYNQRTRRPDEIIGKTDADLFEPQDAVRTLEAKRRVLEFGTEVHDQHWLTSNGRRLFLDLYYEPTRNSTGEVTGIGIAVVDLTKQKTAEEALKASEEELKKLNRTLRALKESGAAMLRATSEADYLDQVCKIIVETCGYAMVWVGYREEDDARSVHPVAYSGFEKGYLEALDVTWADAPRGNGPTGRAIRLGTVVACGNMLTDPRFEPWRAEALKRGYASSLALPLLRGDKAFGAITLYSRQPDPFSTEEQRLLTDLANDLAYGIQAIRMRAARAETERQLRLLSTAVESAVNGIAITDRNAQILWVNPAFTRLTGYSPAEAVGRNPRILKSGRNSPELYRQMWTTLLNGEPWHGELVNRHKDGSLHDEEMTITPVHADGAQITHFVAIKQDISERRRAQAALEQTATELERSNRDLEQFAYVASHDLQEPLRAVGGYVKLLERRFPKDTDAKAIEYIAGAVDGAARMERLISDLLAFSRVGTNGAAFVSADLNRVVAEALENLQGSIAAAGAKVAADPMPTLTVDAGQMTRLFQNLVGNAIKFRGERPPEIHIGSQRQEERWVFSVRDNGIGIDPQYYERIFQIFQRLHTRKHYRGTGIGLAICKKIVERHGGDIWVESRPDQGSTFCFSLPAGSPPKS
jgi:PAS domain S-box-containing protein